MTGGRGPGVGRSAIQPPRQRGRGTTSNPSGVDAETARGLLDRVDTLAREVRQLRAREDGGKARGRGEAAQDHVGGGTPGAASKI